MNVHGVLINIRKTKLTLNRVKFYSLIDNKRIENVININKLKYIKMANKMSKHRTNKTHTRTEVLGYHNM